MDSILFYRTNEAYGNFSNFSHSPILMNSFVWPTVEHYFQASKFTDWQKQDKIREAASPMEAATEGRKAHPSFRQDWNEVRVEVMRVALRAKFFQHIDLKAELLATGEAVLVEHTANDSFWADGGDGTGANTLGKLLMQLRDEIARISKDTGVVLPPWISFPSTDMEDMFWRMGRGEEYLDRFWRFTREHSEWERLRLLFPAPAGWENL